MTHPTVEAIVEKYWMKLAHGEITGPHAELTAAQGIAAEAFVLGKASADVVSPTHTHRWNVEEGDGGELLICRGLHDKALGCEWETFVPKASSAPSQLTEDEHRG